MKKIIGLIFVLLFSVFFATTASASGAITAVEQTILDELKAGVTINGTVLTAKATDIAQAENYLKANDVTSAAASEVVKNIQGARGVLSKQSITATSLEELYAKLSASDKELLKNYILSAAAPLNLKVTFANGVVSFTDAASNSVYKQASANGSNPIIKATGANYLVSILVMAGVLALAVGAFVKTKKMNQKLAV